MNFYVRPCHSKKLAEKKICWEIQLYNRRMVGPDVLLGE